MTALRALLASCLLLSVAACDTLPTRTEVLAEPASVAMPPSAVAAGPAANDNLNALAWMQTSVEFRLIAGQTWRAALGQLDRAIKTPGWDALPREDRPAGSALQGLPPAVILDVDETVLDNTPYQVRLVRTGTGFDDAAWNIWLNEQSARPVPGALEFARAANARGVTLFYISNRNASAAESTIANLRKVGFPIVDASQFLGLGTVVPGCEAKDSDKGCRRQLVGRGHRVLMQVGDQLGDLVSIASNTPQGREQAVRPYLGWVGERWFVLPNPGYGSWEPALFDNDWTRPEAERRQRKLDSLRY